MAKISTYCILGLFLCLAGCQNISGDQVTDTPPDEATSTLAYPVTHSYDTVAVNVSITRRPNRKPDTVRNVIVQAKTFAQNALAVQRAYTSQIGVYEKTGKNDGEQVEKYLRAVGLGKGYPYCAAGIAWSFAQAGLVTRMTAWSPTSFNIKNIVYYQREFKKPLHTADVLSFYYPTLKRIGHCGFWDKERANGMYESVEFNTSGGGGAGIDRDGGGVYRKIRSYNATYAISRHIKE